MAFCDVCGKEEPVQNMERCKDNYDNDVWICTECQRDAFL